MNDAKARSGWDRAVWPVFWSLAAVCLAIFLMVALGQRGSLTTDPDSTLRLVQVRDLLAGQGWFDTTQHRVIPPEGLDLHWSRLFDGALGVLLLLFSQLMSREDAEIALLIAWPFLLLLALLAISASAARERFGPGAAIAAMFAALLIPVFVLTHFRYGNIDHHGLQIVLMAGMVWAALSRSRKAGFWGGIAGAVALAVGLEGVAVLGGLGVVLSLRAVFGPVEDRKLIRDFGLTLVLCAFLLFLLQTPLDQWLVTHCDELAVPILAVCGAAAFYGCLLPPLLDRLSSRRAQILGGGALTAFVGFALIPISQQCGDGPYAMVPQDIRDRVIAGVLENLPSYRMLLHSPTTAIQYVLPVIAAILLLLRLRIREDQRDARAVLLGSITLGFVGSLIQLRLILWALAALPIAAGVVTAAYLSDPKRPSRRPISTVLIVALLSPSIFAFTLGIFLPQEKKPVTLAADANCDRASITSLTEFPAGTVYNPLNLGPVILEATKHSITGASYHRSPDALVNGTIGFSENPEDFAIRLEATGADYVVMCRGNPYGGEGSVGAALSQGEVPEGLSLRLVSQPEASLLIYEVEG
ncbi:hypothetical protein [Litorisediminicola beolgyonensis]|uniref:Glycosyltransferase RgtA/B/C/D-like domain-containing protein n=1 Tax=Litorisediminicola beolgyonensis TaxID=1173614 RepID=A0ABW3ZF78_9RHOB